jgi:hypothetical protein
MLVGVLYAAFAASPWDRAAVLLVAPLLWTFARMAHAGSAWSLVLGAVLLPLGWWSTFALANWSHWALDLLLTMTMVPVGAVWLALWAVELVPQETAQALSDKQRDGLLASRSLDAAFHWGLAWWVGMELAVSASVAVWPTSHPANWAAFPALCACLGLLERRRVASALFFGALGAGLTGLLMDDHLSRVVDGWIWNGFVTVACELHLLALVSYVALQLVFLARWRLAKP